MVRQPKWGHLKELHAAIKSCSKTLLYGTQTSFSLGSRQNVRKLLGQFTIILVFESQFIKYSLKDGSFKQNQSFSIILQAYVFKSSSTECAAFLENNEDRSVTIQFQNIPYQLPPKSISILPDCKSVAFNTAKVKIKRLIYSVIIYLKDKTYAG